MAISRVALVEWFGVDGCITSAVIATGLMCDHLMRAALWSTSQCSPSAGLDAAAAAPFPY
jgi:hypothetical protein